MEALPAALLRIAFCGLPPNDPGREDTLQVSSYISVLTCFVAGRHTCYCGGILLADISQMREIFMSTIIRGFEFVGYALVISLREISPELTAPYVDIQYFAVTGPVIIAGDAAQSERAVAFEFITAIGSTGSLFGGLFIVVTMLLPISMGISLCWDWSKHISYHL
ncbi:hypothetical protein BDB00DRAFT_879356 [Zychaea mexicana]|uniref:uncharacterized protein n=1 Tax=Zychaea mexicana TaxID=64656 RepID=UPI0022FDE072|nr:uncharacterized protein BDB00DRAFT_879356 [Zychaea mexicana]KAI9479498.1 hypothetical protein BDB00DRAFT_879356 [Zychaea mexicana]